MACSSHLASASIILVDQRWQTGKSYLVVYNRVSTTACVGTFYFSIVNSSYLAVYRLKKSDHIFSHLFRPLIWNGIKQVDFIQLPIRIGSRYLKKVEKEVRCMSMFKPNITCTETSIHYTCFTLYLKLMNEFTYYWISWWSQICQQVPSLHKFHYNELRIIIKADSK